MIDARAWDRPTPTEIRDLIHGLRNGRSLNETTRDIGARLGRSRRQVFYWMADPPKKGHSIDYVEWLALRALAGDG